MHPASAPRGNGRRCGEGGDAGRAEVPALCHAPQVDEQLRNDPGIFPTPEVKGRLQPNLAKSAEFTRQLNRAWTRFVTGR